MLVYWILRSLVMDHSNELLFIWHDLQLSEEMLSVFIDKFKCQSITCAHIFEADREDRACDYIDIAERCCRVVYIGIFEAVFSELILYDVKVHFKYFSYQFWHLTLHPFLISCDCIPVYKISSESFKEKESWANTFHGVQSRGERELIHNGLIVWF